MVNLIVPDNVANKPTITAATPSSATYKYTTPTATQTTLPAITITSQDTSATVEITRKTGTGSLSADPVAPGTATWSDPKLTVSGTPSDVNAKLATVKYTPASTDSSEILFDVKVTDTKGAASLCNKQSIRLVPSGVSFENKEAQTTFEIMGTSGNFTVLANGQPIMDEGAYAGTLSATASLIANMINSYTGSPKYTATFNGGASVTVKAPIGLGKDANGLVISIVRSSGNVAINSAGGVKILEGGKSKESSSLDGWFGKVFTGDNMLKILGGAAGGAAGYYLDKMLFPNTGVVDIKLPEVYLNDFGRDDVRISVLYKGRNTIKYPSNYDPTTRVYSGSWGGTTFSEGWTDNPVWVAMDYLTNKLYGCGNYVSMNTTQWTALWLEAYTIAQYCDGLVSNGKGGTEPRYRTNTAVAKMSKIEALDYLTSVFFGKFLFTPERVVLTADIPQTPVLLVGPANVYEEADGKEGIKLKSGSYGSLYNNVNVVWINPDKYYIQDVSNVRDDASIDKYGERTITITAPGATSEGQAVRYAIGYMENEKKDPLTASWKGFWDHYLLRPGQVVRVMPRTDIGTNANFGRVKSQIAHNIFELDRAITISGNPKIYFQLEDGSIAEQTVSSFNSSNNRVTVTPGGFYSSPLPKAGTTWMLGEGRTFRVLTKAENSLGEFGITAYQFDPNKFARIDATPPLGTGNSPT